MSFAAVLLLSGTVALRFRKLSKLAFKNYFSILEKCIIYPELFTEQYLNW